MRNITADCDDQPMQATLGTANCQRIEERFDAMLDAGLLEEVRQLYDRGDLHSELPAMRAVGYRQLWEYFDLVPLDNNKWGLRAVVNNKFVRADG